MKKLFGTDGIRAVAGKFPLNHSSIRILGSGLAALLRDRGIEPRIIIGRDTRESGNWMEEDLVRGIFAAGGSAVSAGIIPTSAVSFLTRAHAFAAGIVLSASHNPYDDNGIKIFSSDGIKIGEDWEAVLEDAIRRGGDIPSPETVEVLRDPAYLDEYALFLKSRFPDGLVPGRMKIVMDCSNGASSSVAPRVFRDLGFDVATLHDSPDGRNINRNCGSLHPKALAEKVLQTGAAMGIAYDGDADRAVWVDENGRILNGDHTLYVQALFMTAAEKLRSSKVIATTMSNMGLEQALRTNGLELIRTRVGDKYVLEEMMRSGANLGGEQSGHTIFLDDCPTGDGILTSLKMAEAMCAGRKPLSELVAGCPEYPQVLVSVRVSVKTDFDAFPEIGKTAELIRASLGEDGRLDLRYSGTEPLARIMIEGRERAAIDRYAEMLAGVVRKNLGG